MATVQAILVAEVCLVNEEGVIKLIDSTIHLFPLEMLVSLLLSLRIISSLWGIRLVLR